ncbi:MAG TPA: Gfo/Idh/MocA family oxidoreductase [Fimbriimonadaceae bacterium]|nr:Gfo/Idh/MocA family oxidoreductase [Fimbriimonadaceae bacterium]
MITVGILGAGGMGNVHARHYRRMNDVELYFYDPDQGQAASFTERHQIGIAPSAEALISRCDVVDLCLPTPLHIPMGLQAIAAGKAVFVEKPMANSLDDAVRLVSAADKAGVTLMPGQVVRFFPEFAAGRRLVQNGAVGNPAAARVRRGGGAPKGSNGWFMDHSRSGGVLIDLGIHDFDWLRWTLGEVKHLYSRSVGAKVGQGPDYALTTLTFDNGCVAHAETTWMDPSGSRATYEVAGSKGLIQYDSRNAPTLRTHAAGKSVNEAPLFGSDDPYYNELRGFLDAVKKNEAPPVTGHDGLMALSIALAAKESAVSDRVVAPARQF